MIPSADGCKFDLPLVYVLDVAVGGVYDDGLVGVGRLYSWQGFSGINGAQRPLFGPSSVHNNINKSLQYNFKTISSCWLPGWVSCLCSAAPRLFWRVGTLTSWAKRYISLPNCYQGMNPGNMRAHIDFT